MRNDYIKNEQTTHTHPEAPRECSHPSLSEHWGGSKVVKEERTNVWEANFQVWAAGDILRLSACMKPNMSMLPVMSPPQVLVGFYTSCCRLQKFGQKTTEPVSSFAITVLINLVFNGAVSGWTAFLAGILVLQHTKLTQENNHFLLNCNYLTIIVTLQCCIL